MGLTLPPVLPPVTTGGAGGDPGGGGDTGEKTMFVGSAISPFLSDGQLITLGVYHLDEADEVAWTVTSAESYNYLLSDDGVNGSGHVAHMAYFGGTLTATCSVNGEPVGTFDAATDIPSPALDPSDPTP